jgi:hypothetical protein
MRRCLLNSLVLASGSACRHLTCQASARRAEDHRHARQQRSDALCKAGAAV